MLLRQTLLQYGLRDGFLIGLNDFLSLTWCPDFGKPFGFERPSFGEYPLHIGGDPRTISEKILTVFNRVFGMSAVLI